MKNSCLQIPEYYKMSKNTSIKIPCKHRIDSKDEHDPVATRPLLFTVST